MLYLLITLLTASTVPAIAVSAAADFTPGSTFRDCDVCPQMVVIPAGKFVMGSSAQEQGRTRDEGPQHTVSIPRALAVGKHEVTRGEYARFVKETSHAGSGCLRFGPAGKWRRASWQEPGHKQTDTHPVVCVGWDDAKAYATWLSRKSSRNYRLLSEAEWEYAARAGTTSAYHWGDNANDACQYANGFDQTFAPAWKDPSVANCADKHRYTAPAGSFKPNAFGLYDMAGNVSEWTEDCFNENYNSAPTNGDAWTSGDCSRRGIRGGGWSSSPRHLRTAVRSSHSVTDTHRLDVIGFRVARTQ